MFDNTNTIHQLRKFYCFISKTRTFFLLFSSYISVAMLGDDKSGGVDEKADYVNNFSNFLFFLFFPPCFLHLFQWQCWGIIRVVVWMRKLNI